MATPERAVVPGLMNELPKPKEWDYEKFRKACTEWIDEKYPKLRQAMQFEVGSGIYHLRNNLETGKLVADDEKQLYNLIEEQIIDKLRESAKSYGIL